MAHMFLLLFGFKDDAVCKVLLPLFFGVFVFVSLAICAEFFAANNLGTS